MKKQGLLLILTISLFSAIQLNAQVKVPSTVKNLKSADLRSNIEQYGLKHCNQDRRGNCSDQTPRGTCTLFATTFLIEYLTARYQGSKNLDYSEEYLNAVTNRAISQWKDGSDFTDALIGYEEFGIVDEAKAPYYAKKPFLPLYLQENTLKQTLDLLAEGKPNVF